MIQPPTSTSGTTAAVIGANGLTGSHLVSLLAGDDYFSKVIAITRKPIAVKNARVKNILFDPLRPESLSAAIGNSEIIFCAIGTTIRKVKGNISEYRKVDMEIPVLAAKTGSVRGCRHYLLVSAVGADPGSRNYYLKIKGETEAEIDKVGLPSFSVFRPSLLLGKRNEYRPMESLGRILMRPFSFLIPSRYKPVHAKNLALAMVAAAKSEQKGHRIYHYKDMASHFR